jgi:GH35 family endo-1,4-beta-xylanase
MQQTPVLSMVEGQIRRNERVFMIKIAGVIIVIITFWGLVGMEVWRRQRDEEYD